MSVGLGWLVGVAALVRIRPLDASIFPSDKEGRDSLPNNEGIDE